MSSERGSTLNTKNCPWKESYLPPPQDSHLFVRGKEAGRGTLIYCTRVCLCYIAKDQVIPLNKASESFILVPHPGFHSRTRLGMFAFRQLCCYWNLKFSFYSLWFCGTLSTVGNIEEIEDHTLQKRKYSFFFPVLGIQPMASCMIGKYPPSLKCLGILDIYRPRHCLYYVSRFLRLARSPFCFHTGKIRCWVPSVQVFEVTYLWKLPPSFETQGMAVTAESGPDSTLFTAIVELPEQVFHRSSCLAHVRNRVWANGGSGELLVLVEKPERCPSAQPEDGHRRTDLPEVSLPAWMTP